MVDNPPGQPLPPFSPPPNPPDQPPPFAPPAARIAPLRTTPALDQLAASVATLPPPPPPGLAPPSVMVPGVGPVQPKLAKVPEKETGFWYCTGSPQEHGGLHWLDKSRLFSYQGPGCPTCPVCKKQQPCWIAVDGETFPEGVLRLI